MEKKISFYAIATTYIGTMFGAGFVSGQEILQFFGCDPNHSIFAALILGILIFIFSFLVMHNSYIKQPKSFEQLIIGNNKFLKYLVNIIFLFFSCGVLIIMFAGAGALINTLFNLPNIIGSITMALIVVIIALNDADGIINTFKVLTPIMFVIALTTSLLGLNINLNNIQDIIYNLKCPGNVWWFSAILYMAYNYFLAIAVLMPLGKRAKSTKDIFYGALLSSIILCLVSITLILALLHTYPIIISDEMPMLRIAEMIHPFMQKIYALVLFGGLLSASIGMIFAIINYFSNFKSNLINNKKRSVPCLCIMALLLSNFGFSNLISIVYPLLGYIGLFALLGVIINYFQKL